MRRTTRLAVLATLTLILLAIQPTTSEAQRRGPVRRPLGRSVVLAGGFYGYPFYDPFFFGVYPWYPYPFWAYPPPWFYQTAYDQTGAIRLEVKPREAQVYVDGQYAGIVDDFDGMFQRLHVAAGDHEVVLYLKGYRTVRQNLHLTPGGDYRVRYTMEPLKAGEANEPPPVPPPRPAPPEPTPAAPPAPAEPAPAQAQGFGALSIRVQPAGAEVLIDGERWQGPEGQERLVVQVSEGTHRVEVRKEGYVTFSTDAQVRGGETATLNVSLPPRDRP